MMFAKESLVVLSLALFTGCSSGTLDNEEFIGETQDALEMVNSLTVNSMTTNSLTTNSLTTNSLTTNSLTTNSLTTNALEAIQDPSATGEASRSVLRYMVACAFRPSQSFDFTWIDDAGVEREEHYVGELGLAPSWSSGPLDIRGQRMISACLAAHVNFYGVHVTLSARSGRGVLWLHPQDPELDEYAHVEGAFWGNIFGEDPYLNSCYKTSNVAYSRGLFRDCATGHVRPDGTTEDCGIINVAGPCEQVCRGYSPASGYYGRCTDRPGVGHMRTDLVITTALP
jgi:hypothetical protein